jgi:hypothetical protein
LVQLREAVESYRMHRQRDAAVDVLMAAADEMADLASTLDHVLERAGVTPADLRNPNPWTGYGGYLS